MDLNQKIAEWVWPNAIACDIKDGHIWVIPEVSVVEGTLIISDYFTTSLDALFKWVVPKLKEMGVLGSVLYIWVPKVCFGEDPALALCYAVEKLIDSQVTIPASEAWLFNNPDARALVQQGLSDAAQGRVSKEVK